MSFYYLATPYSKYRNGIYVAFEEAARQTALLVQSGVPTYSPIAHTHPVAIYGELDPFDHELWLEADRTFMDAARGLIVCMMQGWDKSYGVEQEIKYFKAQGKPIIYMIPGEVPHELLHNQREIIGLCGYATCGKDTAAQGLIDNGWTRIALADGVREALLALDPVTFEDNTAEPSVVSFAELASRYSSKIGWWDELKKLCDVRRLLQRMGTEAGRNIHGEDCWIKIAKRKVDAAPGPVVITDVRFANEAEAIRSWGGKIIRIDRPGVGPVNGHVSEALSFEPDDVIENDGTIADLQIQLLDAARGLCLSESECAQ
jgi:hypothetical protein